MLKLFLWLRYLRKRKIVYLSIAAVALSVLLLIAVSSLFTSFIKVFEKTAVDMVGDVVLTAPIKFAKYPLFIERLERIGAVKAATAILSADGLLHLGKGNVRSVSVWGIEAGRRAKVTSYKQFLLRQKDQPDGPTFEFPNSAENIGGFVGIGVITDPDEKTDEYDKNAVEAMFGRQVVLTTGSPSTTLQREGEEVRMQIKRRTVKFTIADVFETGVHDLDKSFVYLPIEQLQKVLYPDEQEQLANQIQIKLADGVQIDNALTQIRGAWQIFADEQLEWAPHLIRYTDIETAQEMQSRYANELLKQMGVLLLIFGVVSFSVIVLVFCLGYIFTKNVNTIEQWITKTFGLKLWKSSVYIFSRIPNEVNWVWVLVIVLFAIAAAAIGALIPAIVAAKTKPVEILRYE